MKELNSGKLILIRLLALWSFVFVLSSCSEPYSSNKKEQVIRTIGAQHGQVSTPLKYDFRTSPIKQGWKIYSGSPDGVGIIAGLGVGFLLSPVRLSLLVWERDWYSADQFSEAKVARGVLASMLFQVFVRRQGSNGARYGFHYNGDPGKDQYEIKFDGVSMRSIRILNSMRSSSPRPGDILRIEVTSISGYPKISGYVNGQLLLTTYDTAPNAIVTPGRPGIGFRFAREAPAVYPTPAIEQGSLGGL